MSTEVGVTGLIPTIDLDVGMPNFFSKGKHAFATYITGPSHVLLGLEFSNCSKAEPIVVKKPPLGDCRHDESIDEIRLVEVVRASVAKVSPTMGIAEIVYVEDDTPNYILYERAATELAQRYLAIASPPV